ncbi:MAG: nucleotide exchange factor GrpE [Candidatus Komeilibacteria bacterium RIFCSPLOWO2_02_FULL_48_11]|uniref:Protein GrpE n=1 Tax=Candidatus Komeilibacteria bacterium RIFCSPLOWO2_02_FULL_48_11 TaxID=1798553 RepID=A0A1G2BSR5_9BACT|nr:MAG: nucleotide exchange factor GrpE [Candidatus Komeilibacteria bacterium RIFCSPLOWO2_02_FULL_48_11]
MKQEKENKELAELQTKCEEYLSGWKRAQADYQNLKREHEGQMGKLMAAATSTLALGLLPIIDHFELALKHVPEEEAKKDWVQGLAHIKKQFDEFLANCGIKRIETADQPFDPHLHEAVSVQESDKGEDQIIEEVQSGWLINNQVLRHAKVVVAKKK